MPCENGEPGVGRPEEGKIFKIKGQGVNKIKQQRTDSPWGECKFL